MVTLGLGFLAIFLASSSGNVLDLMLMSYAFMVSGLFVPVLGMIFWKKKSETGAVTAMIGGGMITILLGQTDVDLPFGLDPNVFGILASALLFISITIIKSNSNHENTTA